MWGSLTDGGDDDDGVEERTGEGPLDLVGGLVAIPPAHLHFVQDRVLKVLPTQYQLPCSSVSYYLIMLV